jgi:hypothetical protein
VKYIAGMAGCHGRAKFFKHAQSLRPFYRLCSASIRISDKAKIFTWGYLRLIFRAAATPVGCWHVHVSGFEVLAKLVPRVYHPEIAVVVLTRFPNQFLLDIAIKNGAQAALQKTVGSGDLLEPSILKAISAVQRLH